ncbi:MAG: hypothetical protein ACJA13_000405 [Paraglaciecola sp.]|jgi:hypothetical protein
MRFLLLFVLLMGSVFSTVTRAEFTCEVELNYGLVVNDQQIRIIDNSRTLYQINHHNQLLVAGDWIKLDAKQQATLAQLATGLHIVVPKMILLASEGVDLAVQTIEQVYTGLVGKDHDSFDELQSSLHRVQMRIKEKFIHAGDNFYMGPGTLENVDELVDRELEEQIEAAMNTSLGGILSAIGTLVSDSANTDEKIASLARRVENLGGKVESNIGPKADSLKQKAQWFCDQFQILDKLEEQLRYDIEQLHPYNVIVTAEHQVQ